MQFNSKWLLGGQRCIFCLDLWDLWVYTSFVSFVPFFTEAYAHIVGSVVGMKKMTLNVTWSFKNRLPKTSKVLPNLEEITKFPKEPSNWSDDVLVKLQVAFLFLRCKHSIEFASKWLQMLLSRLIRKPLQQKLNLVGNLKKGSHLAGRQVCCKEFPQNCNAIFKFCTVDM